MRSCFLLLLISLSSDFIWAQQTDTASYRVFFNGAGNLNKTNTGTSYIFNNSIGGSYSKNKVNIHFSSRWIYGENPTGKTNNDFIAVGDLDLFRKNHRWYFWAVAAYEISFSLKIGNRLQTGGGPGFNLLDKKNAVIVLTDGLLYEKTHLTQPDIYARTRYEVLRNSFRLKYNFVVWEKLTIDGSHYLQNAFGDSKDYIIRSNSSIGFKLNKWLNIHTNLVYNKQNLTGKSNLLFTYGIGIEKTL